MADHRLALGPERLRDVAAAVAAACGLAASATTAAVGDPTGRWIRTVADDLTQHRGRCLIVAGESQPPEVQSLVHALNHALGNAGRTVIYTQPVLDDAGDGDGSLAALVRDMRAGAVHTLRILGGNPAYTAPADLEFAEELKRLSTASLPDGSPAHFTTHLGLFEDETSYCCQWHLPEAHYLESWGDVRAFDGTASIIQPLIQPLYGGRSVHELMEILLGRPDRSAYEIARGYWQSQHTSDDFELWWRRTLKAGVVDGSAFASIDPGAPKLATASTSAPSAAPAQSLAVVFRPDYTVWDGSFANNPWMQELPKPFTKLTWDNAALIAPKTAERLGLTDQDVVTLKFPGRQVDAPVLVQPGVAPDVVLVHLGYGRTRAGHVGSVVTGGDWPSGGFDAYRIRTTDARWSGSGLEVLKTGRTYPLVMTREHHAMAALEGFDRAIENDALKPHAIVSAKVPEDQRDLGNRRLVRVGTIKEFERNPSFVQDLGGEKEKKPLLSLYPGGKGAWDYSTGYQWGMSIDLTACIGCNACVVACQAENNIPVVGKHEIHRQREMHWLRIDDYFGGSLDDPKVYHQPVPCMHCENAPCEYVCPTGATAHSAEGLNQMTYNRCVGTRYCSNNCPYKVRRFNFLSYADAETTPQRTLQRNPEVTVRMNGVMEKCTYCIQRIQRTRIEAEKMRVDFAERARAAGTDDERRRLTDEAHRREFALVERLQTACQQACPTNAIVFGSINDVAGQQTQVSRLKDEPLDYVLLRELTTRPRTSYLARLRNPHPALEGDGGSGGAG
jgi:molybdopterin-containing oxidoreductase family iron-sulfur binding subunit